MVQIGDFAFIVVKVGTDLNVLTAPIFSIVGVVAIITTFLTSYLINFSYRIGEEVHLNQSSNQAHAHIVRVNSLDVR